LRLETRERVQTNEAKSKRRRASPTETTSRRDNTPASQCLPSRRALLASQGYRRPSTPPRLKRWRAHPKTMTSPGPSTPTSVHEEEGGGREAGLFTIEIAEEDRPRRRRSTSDGFKAAAGLQTAATAGVRAPVWAPGVVLVLVARV